MLAFWTQWQIAGVAENLVIELLSELVYYMID